MYHRPADHEAAPEPAPALLPPVQQPRGLDFLLNTWSGRIVALNFIVFILEVLKSPQASINSISVDTLLSFGAKEPVLLALGEYWRLFTPMFLHGNLLHILFNNWALYAVAYQVEALLGARRFLLLYFLAGIGGNILSALLSLNLSVGASGALFGLFGCALYFERLIQKRVKEVTGFKPKTGAYSVMVIANIAFGFMVPQVDNSAHIGGLIVGLLFGYVLLRATPNRLLAPQLTRARIVGALGGLLFVVMAVISATPKYVEWHLTRAMDAAEVPAEKYFYLNRLIQLDSSDHSRLWTHFRLALMLNDFTSAERDFKLLSQDGDFQPQLQKLEDELATQNDPVASQWLRMRKSNSRN